MPGDEDKKKQYFELMEETGSAMGALNLAIKEEINEQKIVQERFDSNVINKVMKEMKRDESSPKIGDSIFRKGKIAAVRMSSCSGANESIKDPELIRKSWTEGNEEIIKSPGITIIKEKGSIVECHPVEQLMTKLIDAYIKDYEGNLLLQGAIIKDEDMQAYSNVFISELKNYKIKMIDIADRCTPFIISPNKIIFHNLYDSADIDTFISRIKRCVIPYETSFSLLDLLSDSLKRIKDSHI